MKRLITLLSLALAVTACSQNAPSTDTSALEARSDAWESALNSKDVDALVSLYTDDARLLPPDGAMTSGQDGVRAAFGGMIDAGIGGETTRVETTVNGNIGYIVGTFTLVAGDELLGTGKYIETWQRGDDGLWMISNDIYNNDPSPKPKMDMTHIMITHSVDDADRWMAAWSGPDSRKGLFKDNGAAHVHAFRSEDNPNLTGLVIAVKDMDALNAMLMSDEGMAAAAEDGVRADTMVVMTEVN
jgi:ketosteroid isomerase-like protein